MNIRKYISTWQIVNTPFKEKFLDYPTGLLAPKKYAVIDNTRNAKTFQLKCLKEIA